MKAFIGRYLEGLLLLGVGVPPLVEGVEGFPELGDDVLLVYRCMIYMKALSTYEVVPRWSSASWSRSPSPC